jgi:hypothetical protein
MTPRLVRPNASTLARARQNVLVEVKSRQAISKLLTFYDPAGRYAGLTFLDLQPVRHDAIGASDFMAPSLMSAPLTPKQVRALIAASPQIRKALRAVPETADLAIATEQLLAGPAWQLHDVVRKALNTGEGRKTKAPLKTDKLCARKRPGLFPVRDSRITAKTKVGHRGWLTFQALLQDPAIVAALQRARLTASQTNIGVAHLPLLRVLDTILWMPFSLGNPVVGGHSAVTQT